MKETNYLKTRLVECENPVGKKKTSNWVLPPVDFVYGKKEKEDKEGVSIITRSWHNHEASQQVQAPQDYVQINKMAVKMNAISHSTHKDFRKNVDIKKKMPCGTNERRIYLPPEDFTYGRKNRTPTPVKDIINYEYARKAEEVIKMDYKTFLSEKSKKHKLEPKSTKYHENLLNKRKTTKLKEEKPLYKLKMFQGVDSKVRENLKNFKTYTAKKDNLDCLIEKVENELKELDQNQAQ